MSETAFRLNLLWVIAILIAVISVLLWKLPNGEGLSGYISFASSIASLILSVVAIFYSIISNSELHSNVSLLKQYAESVELQSKNFDDIAEGFIHKIEELADQVGVIPTHIDGLTASLNEKIFKAQSDVVDTGDSTENESKFWSGRSTVGMNVAAYLIARSEGKGEINLSKIFSNKNYGIRAYVGGVLAVLSSIKYKNFDITIGGSSFEVENLHGFNVDALIQKAEKKDHSVWKKAKIDIDKYFDSAPDE